MGWVNESMDSICNIVFMLFDYFLLRKRLESVGVIILSLIVMGKVMRLMVLRECRSD